MANRVGIDVDINVQDKNAQSRINKLQAGLASFAGQEYAIKFDLKGGDEASRQLLNNMEQLKQIRKIAGQKVKLFDLDSLKAAIPIIENALNTATGKARNNLLELKTLVDNTIAGIGRTVRQVQNERRSYRAVGGLESRRKVGNEGREVALRNINDNLEIARQNGNLKEQLSLLKQKRNILEAIDKANRAATPSADLVKTRQEITDLQKKIALQKQANAEAAKQNAVLSSQGTLLSGLSRLATRYLSIFTVAHVIDNMAKTAGYFQQQQVALEGILGSATKAKQVLDEIKNIALESPFQTKELVRFTKQLSAFGVNSNELVGTMKSLADISAGLGVDMGRIILAYGQVKSAAVLRGQELRQFTEAGIPMVEALSKKLTEVNGRLVTTGEVFKFISERKVPFEMVASVLSDMTAEGGKFYKMQESLTDTLYGQIEKLKDVWTLTLNDVGSTYNRVFRTVVDWIVTVMRHSKSLFNAISAVLFVRGIVLMKRGFDSLGGSMAAVSLQAHRIKTSFTVSQAAITRLTGATNAWAMSMVRVRRAAAALGSILASGFGMAALAVVSAILTEMYVNTNKLKDELKEVDSTYAKETSKLISGFDSLLYKIQGATEGTKAYNEALSSLENNYGDYLNKDMLDALVKQKEGWEDIAKSIRDAIREVQNYNNALDRAGKAGESVEGDVNDNSVWDRFFNRGTSANTTRDIATIIDNIYGSTEEKARNINDRFFGGNNVISGSDISEFSQEDANRLIAIAIKNFFSNKGKSREDLDAEIRNLAASAGIKNVLSAFSGMYFSNMESQKGWKDYLANINQAEKSPLNLVRKAFEEAIKKAGKETDLTWKYISGGLDTESKEYKEAGALSGKYNPINWEDAKQEHLIDAVISTVTNQWGESASRIIKDELKKVDDISGRPLAVARALDQLKETLKDDQFLYVLRDITKQFNELARVESGRTIQVNDKIRDILQSGARSAETKDFYKRYLASDSNYQAMEDKVEADRKSTEAWLQSHKRGTGAQAIEYDTRKREKDMLDDLFSNIYQLKDKEKKGGGSSEPVEIRDFLTRVKEAYDVYKKATQAEGAEMGLSYMQGDEKMKKLFYNLFHAGEAYTDEKGKKHDMFLDENGNELRIGKSGKALREILGDDAMYIQEGLEKGVIDFEKAFRRIGQALKDYGKADEKHRKGFISLGDSYLRFADQISKDNVAAWIAKINKEFTDLGKTFERTSQQVELYRSLMTKGTAKQLGKYSSSNRFDALTPDSVRNAGNIQEMVALYNTLVKGQAKQAGKDNPSLLSIGELTSVGGIQSAINEVSRLTKLNNANFGAGEYGEAGKKIESLLEKQLGIIIKELQSQSGQQFTGKKLVDAIANTMTRISGSRGELDIAESTALGLGMFNGEAMEKHFGDLEKAASDVFEKFLGTNLEQAIAHVNWRPQIGHINFKGLEEGLNGVIQELVDKGQEDLAEELSRKFKDLKDKVNAENAKLGYGALDSLFEIFTARKTAKRDFDEETRNNAQLSGSKIALEGQRSMYKKQLDAGNLTPDLVATITQKMQDLDTQIIQVNLDLAQSNDRLEELGQNGEKQAGDRIKKAFENIQAVVQADTNYFNVMKDAMSSIINAASAMTKTISRTYDIMNDGKNPEALQKVEGFMEDFGEAFENVVAPIGAVLAMILALTIAVAAFGAAAGIAFGVIIAAAAIFAGIVALFQMHDRALQREIERLDEKIKDTENVMKNLDAEAKRMSGYRKMSNELKSLSGNYDIYLDKLKQAQLEEDKKNTDNEKVKEYKQGAQESLDEFLNSLKDATDGITGSVQDWAGSLSNALRSAFQNGENAARAFRNTAIEMVGDIVNKIIEMTILEPMIENAINGLLGYSLDKNSSDYIGNQDRFKNEDGSVNSQKLADYVTGKLSNDNAAGIIQFMETVQGGYANVIDFINNELAKPLKEAWAYNSDTSELSGGIQGITEDTARTLEGLSNSMLAQLVLINRSTGNMEVMAMTQTSRLNDMLVEQRAMRKATDSINSILEGSRDGTRSLHVRVE